MTVNRFDPSSESLTPATTQAQPLDSQSVQQATSSIINQGLVCVLGMPCQWGIGGLCVGYMVSFDIELQPLVGVGHERALRVVKYRAICVATQRPF